MISFEQTWEEQKDLKKLCIDLPVKNSNEIFPPNDYYGHAGVLKDYMEVDWGRPLMAIIQHGVILGQKFIWKKEIESPLPAFYCWQESIASTYARTGKRVILGAAPMMHAMKVMDYKPRDDRQGTIFFAAHSTHSIAAIYNREKTAKRLVDLPEKYQPVTICLYWRDYQLDHAKPYLEHGLRVISAGGMWDRNFCYRWLHLVSAHRYAATNDIGSSLFYAAATGMPVLYLKEKEIAFQADNEEDSQYEKEHRQIEDLLLLENLFNKPINEPTMQQMVMANRFVGINNMKSPEALRDLLL